MFYETLRLWPGVPKNVRRAIGDDVLPAIPEQGYPEVAIAKGDYLLWSDFAMMRNEKVCLAAWKSIRRTYNIAVARYGGMMRKNSTPVDT